MAEYELPDWYKQIALEAAERAAEFDKQLKELKDKVDATTANVNRTTNAVNKTSVSLNNMCKEVGGIGESNGAVAEEAIFNALDRDMTFGGVEFYDMDRNRKRNY